MDHFDGLQASLQAQAHIWNHVFNFINSMSLKCAIELCIPDAIHKHGGQPVTLSQLVTTLGIPPGKEGSLRRLMRLLTHSGFFTMQYCTSGDHGEEEAYLPTKYSEHLLSDNPRSVSPFVRIMLDPCLTSPWQSLSAWFRTSSPTPFHHLNHMSAWEKTSQTSELNNMFNEGMASDSYLTMAVFVGEHGEVFRGLKSLVDVGGGTGATAMVLVEAFPQLKCTVLDLPHVVASAPNCSSTVEFVAGDMFEYVPPAHAVLLKWVLHDWSDEQCVKLLKLCKAAIPSREEEGKVIIVDMVVREDLRCQELRETQDFFDMLMMVHTEGGKERDEKEWSKLFSDAGFSGYKITPELGLRTIIEVFP